VSGEKSGVSRRGQPLGQPFTYDIQRDFSDSETFQQLATLVRRIPRFEAWVGIRKSKWPFRTTSMNLNGYN
jgi:hypothetical protein